MMDYKVMFALSPTGTRSLLLMMVYAHHAHVQYDIWKCLSDLKFTAIFPTENIQQNHLGGKRWLLNSAMCCYDRWTACNDRNIQSESSRNDDF